jgi:ribose/xylose/arabinose/galactoside ABC-type transport system permease subunit
VFLVAVFVNGLFLQGVAFWVQYLLTGLILISAVAIPRLFARESEF